MILMNDCWRLVGIVPDANELNRSNARAVAHQGRLSGSLKRWEKAFQRGRLRPLTSALATDPDACKAVILEIHHALITIKVAVCLDYPDEMAYDFLLPSFSTIVSPSKSSVTKFADFQFGYGYHSATV